MAPARRRTTSSLLGVTKERRARAKASRPTSHPRELIKTQREAPETARLPLNPFLVGKMTRSRNNARRSIVKSQQLLADPASTPKLDELACKVNKVAHEA
mmetsp:Transcript_44792/g.136725  ORF Transcript_44792/g.136725 Transcript_44792/m.136725 type:complete len:100 (+) Transcript_44792:1815-2114(+)